MKTSKRLSRAGRAAALLLTLALATGALLSPASSASSNQTQANNGRQKSADKVSPDLREKLRGQNPSERVSLILQSNGPWDARRDDLLASFGVLNKKSFDKLGAVVVELPANAAEALASYDEFAYVSMDNDVQSFGGHVAATTGANLVRPQTSSTGAAYNLDGTNVGIAILDSGITQDHKDFLNQRLDHTRVTFAKDFTSENFLSSDRYGHGTHVAALAAGMGFISSGAYIGMAPNASIINLKVLDRNGKGKSSDVLAALNWLLSNYKTYNVKVVNISLGTPAINSYKNDPLCQAARKLVDAGLVVVAAAGNDGKDSAGNKQYGTIHSP